jgi:hypothetical protein
MQQFGILVWWLLISVIGLAAAPLTWRIFKNLPDRGYAFSKPVGLLFVGLVSWLLGFAHFSTLTILLALGLLAGLSYWIWKNHEAEIRAWVAQNAGYLLVAEGFFLLLFMLFVLFRMFNPDIIGTEKFMDLAFMNSLSRATSFPPFDPWMAGKAFSISYYYFGYLFMAILLKLSAVPPAVGFNLALGLLFALAGFSVFGLIYNLTRRLSVAAAGWGAVFMLGNLDGVKQVLVTKTMENFNWWTPSRVIPDTINEFPFFSFLLGDMHPHMLAIPFVVTALALALNHLKSDDPDLGWKHGDNAVVFTFWGVVIGALGFLNSWDLPTLFFVAMLVFFFQQFRLRGAVAGLPWKDMGLGLGLILAAAVIPYLPFYLNFHSKHPSDRLFADLRHLGFYGLDVPGRPLPCLVYGLCAAGRRPGPRGEEKFLDLPAMRQQRARGQTFLRQLRRAPALGGNRQRGFAPGAFPVPGPRGGQAGFPVPAPARGGPAPRRGAHERLGGRAVSGRLGHGRGFQIPVSGPDRPAAGGLRAAAGHAGGQARDGFCTLSAGHGLAAELRRGRAPHQRHLPAAPGPHEHGLQVLLPNLVFAGRGRRLRRVVGVSIFF